jgi:phage terminase small subunit
VINVANITEKQKRFVDEYLIDLNATRAYKAAYPSVKKDEVAASAAVRLLRNVKVQAYMKERQKKIQERTEVTQDRVILELARIAFSNGSDFAKVVTKPRKRMVWNDQTQEYEEKEIEEQFVELIDTDKLPPEKRAAIASIKEGKYGIEVSSCDKVKALELIGKHIGMFKEKVEISGQVNNPFEGLTTEELKKLIYDE